MEQYGPETYGERVADVYDEWYSWLPDGEKEAEFLAEVAGTGAALELGIGTGRVALPLAALGVTVSGIDASPAIVEQMRAKPGGDVISVTVGDMADVAVDGRFSLVYVVFNTFFMLPTADAQARCFRSVATHLTPGGRFVVHAFVPDQSLIDQGERVAVKDVGVDEVRLDATKFFRPEQRLDTTQIRITEQGIRLVHAKVRYTFPSQLDEMAEDAGLTLDARYGGFAKEPFTDQSAFHVSVYRPRT
jgi:SAM-dependent methyltransferase